MQNMFKEMVRLEKKKIQLADRIGFYRRECEDAIREARALKNDEIVVLQRLGLPRSAVKTLKRYGAR